MAVQVALEHRTTYHFDRPVGLGPHTIRLRPAPHTRTPVSSYSLTITGPPKHFVNWQQDAYGNHLARVVFPDPATDLTITVGLVADMTVINPFDFFVEQYAETFPVELPGSLAADLSPYTARVTGTGGELSPLLTQWLPDLQPKPGTTTVQALADLNRAVADRIGYRVRMETGVQTPQQTLETGIGSCRDSGWLLVAILRELGFAARFASGYLVQLRSDTGDGPSDDFTDLHAWAEVYVPGAGWIGLDATSGLFAGEGHIPLSATPNPADSAAVTGTVGPCTTTMEYRNTVTRFAEAPRSTKPYTDAQWAAFDALGAHVDELLAAGDVRLTMGGEPTFVSASDPESAQWHIAADGEDKRAMALDLAAKLTAHYAPDGVVHHGQGKWYPGEPLPRWQIAITWRTDGTPLWRDATLLDDPWSSADRTPADAERLARAVAGRIGAPADVLLPAYEDELDRLTWAARVPEGEPPAHDPSAGDLQHPDARARLIATLDAAVPDPTGWVLPLHRTEDGERWATTRWRFRRGRLVLTPGSSAVGLRLPLDSIGWTPPSGRPDTDAPFDGGSPLPPPPDDVEPAELVDVADAPTTALTIEARDGHVFVFLPPLPTFADAVALLTAVEQAAAAERVPVVLEGYGLPGDPRATTLTVTPDPGVIEVNVQPSRDWVELREITTSLDAAAREVGLATEKFALDGTHAGTGGGSHLTLGGVTPADSPLLRRPDLLVSLLTFWQHHPSLSYLFSGRFIGPTSQAPRVDEARHEYLYELEIAFAELERLREQDGAARPWVVDRALRHLLTDITGNTHRAEFCIDKLFSPDSSRGRLGLLELRGFEMPPHPQMSLVQALLVRCLVARFWAEPYRAPLVRWGTQLHDRFLLPDPCAADVAEVVDDLQAHGIDFRHEWLTPFVEFRFPRLGSVQVGPVTLELRQGIEPWHVLGEEATGSGTARYVDSSLERVQVRATGVLPGRHVVTCNGVPVPLRSMPDGAGVAGIRFRAWAPPSALHPTIGVQAPLTFDVVDLWSGHSLGGCTYHVVHPGGRAYDRFPVNANEAEARRAGRFVTDGHTAGPVEVAAQPAGAEYPWTLDLRRAAPAP